MATAYNFDTGEGLTVDSNGQWVKAKTAVNPKTGAVAVLDSDGSWKEAKENRSWLQGAGRAIDSALGGAYFGFRDELAAAGRAIGGKIANPDIPIGDIYDAGLRLEQAKDARFREENPGTALAAEVAGGLGMGALAAPIAGAAGLGQVASNVPTVLKYAGLGAGAGALSGAGNAAPGERLEGAGTGALIGGGLGAATPFVARGVSAVAAPILGPITSRLSRVPESAAGRKIAEAFGRDRLTPAEIQSRLSAMGPEATIADAAGGNTLQLGAAQARLPGETVQKAMDVLDTRAQGAGPRIMEGARQDLGTQGDFYGTVDSLIQSRAAAARPLYEKAYTQTVQPTETVAKILSTPAGQAALDRAQRLVGNEMGQPLDLAGNPSVQTLDYIKRGFDDVLEQYRDKTTGRLVLDTEGRGVEQLRRQYLSELDKLSPDYAAARQAYAGPSESLDALEKGRSFLRKDAEITDSMVKGMSPGERQFFLEGVTRGIDDMIKGQSVTADQARRLLKVPKNAEALQAAFPDLKSYNNFMMRLGTESKFANTRNQVLGGSQTAQRLAAQGDAGMDTAIGPLVEATRGNLSGAIVSGLSQGFRKLTALPESTRNQIGEMLFSQDPAMQQQALAAIGKQAQMLGLSKARKQFLEMLTAVETGAIAGDAAAPGANTQTGGGTR